MEKRVSGVLERSFILSEASFVYLTSKRLARGKLEFLSPSTKRYLQLATLWTPLDYLYLVEVLHKHLINLRTLLRMTLQG